MADAAVEYTLEHLQQLLVYHDNMITDAKNEVEKLENDLRLFRAFLKHSTKKRRKDDSLRELTRKMRDVVYEVEDIIDAFLSLAADSESKNYFLRTFQPRVKLLAIVKEVEEVAAKVRYIYGDKRKLDFADPDFGDEIDPPIVRVGNTVGFEEEAEKLVGFLTTEETPELDVISITGMPGLGKTTLAEKIFRNPVIQYDFPTRIWVYISQEFTRKDVFLAILRELTRLTEDMYRKTDEELAQLIVSHLQEERFLIVMDDVWTTDDWDKLQISLPKWNKMGKVLITSRNQEVARYANRNRVPFTLQFLTHEKSWLLLQLVVFGKPECPPELEVLGRLIAEQCDGLPLLLVVIGGVLVNKSSKAQDMYAKKRAWEKVSESVSRYLFEDQLGRTEKIISLAYDKLPHHLRPCFLYLGMFPQDFKIPAWKLFSMWIAEGFIPQRDGLSLEETAESYLDDLIYRSLVTIEKIKSDGRVKTCSLRSVVRDFCIIEAGNERENFLQEIYSSGGIFEHPILDIPKFRRLCVHSEFLNFISSEPFGPQVRSLVSFSEEEIDMPPENSLVIPDAFKLLKVLDLKPIRFTRIPSALFQLIHLRYMAIAFHLSIIPSAFSKLWNLRTLIVDTTSPTIEVKADIWKMSQLRHLKTNVSTTLPEPTRSSKGGEMLQTLGTISAESCTKEIFDKARNVKELAIRGRLALLLEEENGCSFDSIARLGRVEKLKLLNDVFPCSPLEGRLHGLPPPYKFPYQLSSLTLSATFLDWKHISTLALLENLSVLKLKDNAFVGRLWKATDGGFRHLEVLNIEFTDLAVWEASGRHFPRLRYLELHNCESLRELPIGLADIPALQVLDLSRTTSSAAASAKKIMEAKKKQIADFKLSVFPPYE